MNEHPKIWVDCRPVSTSLALRFRSSGNSENHRAFSGASQKRSGAGRGNRTLMACLEGRNFTTKLYPRDWMESVVARRFGQFEIPRSPCAKFSLPHYFEIPSQPLPLGRFSTIKTFPPAQDGWQSGLMRTPGKRVCRKATGVRIPPHPPDFRLARESKRQFLQDRSSASRFSLGW